LTSEKQQGLNSILPAAKLLQQQIGINIQIRSNKFHDRFWIIDNAAGYQSSASIKDGGRNAAAVILEVLDAFISIQSTYENLWNTGAVKHP